MSNTLEINVFPGECIPKDGNWYLVFFGGVEETKRNPASPDIARFVNGAWEVRTFKQPTFWSHIPDRFKNLTGQ